MSNAISDARTQLHDALKAMTTAPWRIYRTSPEQPTAPQVFIDSPELRSGSDGVITISFPVVMVYDGSVRKQIDSLDECLAQVWTAANSVGTPTNSRPVALDVGGPSLRAQILDVEMFLTVVSMCPPTMISAPELQPEPHLTASA